MKELNKLISFLFTFARLLLDVKAWYYLFTGKPGKWLKRMRNKFIGRSIGRIYR